MTVAELKDILDDFDGDVEIYIGEHGNSIRDIFNGVCNDNEEEFLLIVT